MGEMNMEHDETNKNKMYDETKWYRIIDNAQSNYAYQLKRLSKNDQRANFILIYYSLSLLVYSLTVKFFPSLLNADTTSFFGIVLSIIILIYSIINSNSRYPERIAAVQQGLNKMKSLKRRLKSDGEFDKVREEYEKVVNGTEMRDDTDFYYTVCHLCKEYGIKRFSGKDVKNPPAPPSNRGDIITIKSEIRGYISELNPFLQVINIISRNAWHIILYLAPVLIFLFCMYAHC